MAGAAKSRRTLEPACGTVQPYLWKWDDIYRGLMWANDVVPMEETGRRTINLKNPGLRAGMTQTIHMSVQSVLPGEIATAHRHNFSAKRFILKGSPQAATVVEGERLPMRGEKRGGEKGTGYFLLKARRDAC